MNSTETPGGSGIPAGWYDDPSGSGLRWWDGEQWTEHVHTAESAAAAAATDASVAGEREAPPPELVKLRESIRSRGAKGVGLVLGGAVLVIVVIALLVSGGSDNGNAGESGTTVPPAAKTAANQAQIKSIDKQLQKKSLSKATRKKLAAMKKRLEVGTAGGKSATAQGQGEAPKQITPPSGKGS